MDPDLSCIYYIILKSSLKAFGGLNTIAVLIQHLMSKIFDLRHLDTCFISQRKSFRLISVEVHSSDSYFLCSSKE